MSTKRIRDMLAIATAHKQPHLFNIGAKLPQLKGKRAKNMEFSGTYLIFADRWHVWRALNDTQVLQRAIPRCQNIRWSSPATLDLTIQVNLGVMKPKFSGELTLSDVDEAQKYTLSGRGRGGVLGLAHGSADIKLADREIAPDDFARLHEDGYWPDLDRENKDAPHLQNAQAGIYDFESLSTGTLLTFSANGGASKHIMALGKTIIGKSAQGIIDRFMARFSDAMGVPMLPKNELLEYQE